MNEAPREKLKLAQLYGIVDLGYIAEDELSDAAESLIKGGADILQLRAKGYSPDQVEMLARPLVPLCQGAGIPFIINDFPEVAARVNADGVHIGQEDGSLMKVREIVGANMLVGRSTHSKEQAEIALREGFDYIGFGPLFPTPTKQGRPGIGLEDVFYVEQKIGSQLPVFCIGGIKRSNVKTVIEVGATRVVIVSDLLSAPSIKLATIEAKSMLTPII